MKTEDIMDVVCRFTPSPTEAQIDIFTRAHDQWLENMVTLATTTADGIKAEANLAYVIRRHLDAVIKIGKITGKISD